MKIYKYIFTYFFILVYGISFGHQIIPHHHHDEAIETVHNHCAADLETHDHISHEHHFDEGLIDYLACLLGNHEHNPLNECQYVVAETSERAVKHSVNLTADFYPPLVIVEVSNAHPKLKFAQQHWVYENPISQKRALRGPPFNMA